MKRLDVADELATENATRVPGDVVLEVTKNDAAHVASASLHCGVFPQAWANQKSAASDMSIRIIVHTGI